MKILTSIFAIAFCLINTVENFIPAKILDEVINKLDSTLSFDFGKVNPTLTHEEILRRGIIKSVANYFYAKENGSILIDKSKVDNEYLQQSDDIAPNIILQYCCFVNACNANVTEYRIL